MKKLVAITMLLVSTWALQANAEDGLLTYGGKTYQASDLSPSAQQTLFDLEDKYYQAKKSTLENEVVLKLYIEEKAKAGKKTYEAMEQELLKVKDPSEKEIKAFYDENKNRIPYPFEKVKGEIKNILVREQKGKAQETLLAKIMKEKKVTINLTEPKAPVIVLNVADYPSKGNKAAKVKIVEFADYQCPHCRKASTIFQTVLKKYADDVYFTYVDFPINPSGISRKVARGSHCANKQGKYWEYHYMAFERQPSLNATSPTAFAKELKLDMKAFEDCYASDWSEKMVEDGRAEGDRVGVAGTPTVFINGKKDSHAAHSEEELEKAIKEALNSASS